MTNPRDLRLVFMDHRLAVYAPLVSLPFLTQQVYPPTPCYTHVPISAPAGLFSSTCHCVGDVAVGAGIGGAERRRRRIK